MKKNILDQAYEKAIECIKKCSTSHGLYASGGKKGYHGVWARDSMISLIGARVCNDENKEFIQKQFEKSLNTLAKYQSKHGEIPNAVLNLNSKKPKSDHLSIDSSLWFIIGEYVYKKRYGDNLFKKHKKIIEKTINWIEYQDFGDDILLEQLPTTDWQDAFPQRYGRTINTQALYYFVLNLIGKNKIAEKLKSRVNYSKEYSLWSKNFYYSYRWKNHNKYKEVGEWFDSLGNLLAIVFDIADKEKSNNILNYIKNEKINLPYPVMSIYPPIRKSSRYWEDYYLDSESGKPYHYLNAGIWPYIGSFYVLALIKMKKYKEAEKELRKLAEINLKGNFPEWINPLTKKYNGQLQAWDAGSYILAYESLKKKRVMI